MERLNNKIAIVTGRGSGFGESIAKVYAKEGAKVANLDLNFKATKRVAMEIGDNGVANMLSKSMANELAAWKIRVNTICPVMGRLAEPSDIANAALYLASDEAAFITSVELSVDGGRTV